MRANRMSGESNALHIHELPSEIMDTANHHQGQFIGMCFNGFFNVFFFDACCAGTRRDGNQICVGITAMETNLTGQSVLI